MTARRLRDDEVPAVLEHLPGLAADHKPCEECGLMPLYFETDYSPAVRVDGCLGFLTSVLNACCGHGGRKPAYVRISTADDDHIDICGGEVVGYATYTGSLP